MIVEDSVVGLYINGVKLEDFADNDITFGNKEIETIQAQNSDIKFLKPDFECELLKEIKDHNNKTYIIGYSIDVREDIEYPYAKTWTTDGQCWDDSDVCMKEFNLTPYKEKKVWYEDESNIGKLLKYTRTENIYGTFREYKDGYVYIKLNSNKYPVDDFILATNEEIDSLKK